LKNVFFLLLFFTANELRAQSVGTLYNSAYKKFTADKSLRHAITSIYIINTTKKSTVASVNTEVGLAPASCQKIIIASTAFELLGHNYVYKTSLGYTGKIENAILYGNIVIKGNGDPTLGSWRYQETVDDSIISEFKKAISREGINEIKGNIYADENLWKGEVTPDGWIWQDIGSYYGAGARALNWRENQYDLFLKSGSNIGNTVEMVRTNPAFVEGLDLKMAATSAEKGSGDNAYIYVPLNEKQGYLRGTIPVNEDSFTISGAMPHPSTQLALTLEAALKKISVEEASRNHPAITNGFDLSHIFYTHNSPPLDSIIYWFLKKSINLYGEALAKTIAYEITKTGATDSAVNVIKTFWSKKGIDPGAMNILDGSGLSPANRVTTTTLVNVLEYAKKQPWFSSFYNALPEINGIKMKSGSIGGVVSYTGFIKSKTGVEYTFAFIVNNFEGGGNEVRKKMWALLDILK
jgi:D-alanyl-D-alanine carboxypeptidase/D-alanyl-D-alanine-endopeptidase (penicillin-binding protein 4)